MASQRFLLNENLPIAQRLAEQRVLTGLYERLPGVRAIAEFQRARRVHVPTAELWTSDPIAGRVRKLQRWWRRCLRRLACQIVEQRLPSKWLSIRAYLGPVDAQRAPGP